MSDITHTPYPASWFMSLWHFICLKVSALCTSHLLISAHRIIHVPCSLNRILHLHAHMNLSDRKTCWWPIYGKSPSEHTPPQCCVNKFITKCVCSMTTQGDSLWLAPCCLEIHLLISDQKKKTLPLSRLCLWSYQVHQISSSAFQQSVLMVVSLNGLEMYLALNKSFMIGDNSFFN